jgi:hypothetical protein
MHWSRLWYRAVLSDARMGPQHVPTIGEAFVEVLGDTEWPDGACLFLAGRDALFFSPAAIAVVPHLIVACGARPSLPPERACLTLVAGRESDWALLPYARH